MDAVANFFSTVRREFPMSWIEDGDMLAVISKVGPSGYASWGYTIWKDGSCLAGAKDWNWTADDASVKALEALASLKAPAKEPDAARVAIDELVPAARKVLDWLRSVGGFIPEVEMPLSKALARLSAAQVQEPGAPKADPISSARPGLAKAMEASWKQNEAAFRYLGEK